MGNLRGDHNNRKSSQVLKGASRSSRGSKRVRSLSTRDQNKRHSLSKHLKYKGKPNANAGSEMSAKVLHCCILWVLHR